MNLNIMHVHLQWGLLFHWFSHLSLWDLHCSRRRLWSLSHPVASSSLRLCPPAASSVWLAPPVQQRTTVRKFPLQGHYPTQPPPSQLHTTNKPQHKRFTDADVAYRHAGHTCSCERWVVSSHIWEDWGKVKYRRHYTKKVFSGQQRNQTWGQTQKM